MFDKNSSCHTDMLTRLKVESAFSIMGELIDDKSARTNINTYSAIQSVKYRLKAEGKDAVDFFRKADYLRDPVHPIPVKNMTTSNRRYKEELQMAREENKRNLQELNVKKGGWLQEEDLTHMIMWNIPLVYWKPLKG